jgi:hypothetical protein
MLYDVTIPPNSSATLTLPVPPPEVRQSGKPIATKNTAKTELALAAGTYHFAFRRALIQ